MAHRAVFFDRDGVLNIDKAYLYKIDELEWIEGALEAITYLTQSGYLVFVVTNQSGIARGYYTVGEMEKLHQYMSDTVSNSGGKIEKFYYCPHLPNNSIFGRSSSAEILILFIFFILPAILLTRYKA